MLMKPLLPVALMLIGGAVQACGCSPDSLVFQDAFFKYCDAARAAWEAEAPLAEAKGDQVTASAEAGQQGGPGESASQPLAY
jgi:hypothetical protein